MVIATIEAADVCIAGVLVGTVLWVGNALVQPYPVSRRIGLGLGVIAGGTIFFADAFSANDRSTPVELMTRLGVIGGLTTGITWCVLPIVAFVYQFMIAPMIAALQSAALRRSHRLQEWRDARRERQEGEQRRREYERGAPERDRQRQREEERAAAERAAETRREAARTRCDLAFAFHAPDLRARFSRADFERFVATHFRDDRPPEEVEERAEQLIALLEQHRQSLDPLLKFRSLNDLARWFSQQKTQMEAIPDERLKRTMLAQLNARYAELTARLLEELRL